MNKFRFYFILFFATVVLFSCSKDEDTIEVTPPRDYATQYATDIADIEEFLKSYYIKDISPDVYTEIIKIPVGGTQASIWTYLNNPTFPKLLSKTVAQNDISYKLYYLVLREGTGEYPVNIDGVLAAYKGEYLSRVTEGTASTINTTLFEEVKYPNQFFDLLSVISGWRETFPEFRMGTSKSNADGTVKHSDYGAGVLFIPSGLGYYDRSSGTIPSYSNLVFSINLLGINRLDQEGDQVPSVYEDLNGDRYIRVLASGVVNPDDTDGDGTLDFFDADDDGDNFSTKLEIKRPDIVTNGVTTTNGYYPYNGAAVDDIRTPNVDERQGIPSYNKVTKTLDYTTPGRLRIHLDKDYPLK